jgi:hypothetical protein
MPDAGQTLAVPIVVALVPAALVAILTAVVTVRLSIRQFRSQAWWERKLVAYTDALDQMMSTLAASRIPTGRSCEESKQRL